MNNKMWTPGQAVKEFARSRPEEVVLICAKNKGGEDKLTRLELDSWSDWLAHKLIERGVSQGDYVAIVFPTCIQHVVATMGTYKAGGTPMPISYRMPPAERDAFLELANPKCILSSVPELSDIIISDMPDFSVYPKELPKTNVPQPTKVLASGGSTGKPKLIISSGAFQYPAGEHPLAQLLQLQPDDMLFSPGPLYHNGPFFFTQIALFHGSRVMLNERFQANRTLDLIENFHPSVLNLVPTMMQRMLRESDFGDRDLSSIRTVWHLAAPCPEWAKIGFIDRFGADAVMELWAATEMTGLTIISGSEWLMHRGSVGKGLLPEFKILDEKRNELPIGEVGEIFSRFSNAPPDYHYLGASQLEMTSDNFASVGDLGHLDKEGYLYLADRRTDMIISGGANIFPAEIEAVISSHEKVRDVAVIGLLDEDLGRKVWAVVQPDDTLDPPDIGELESLCQGQLALYKVPRGFELVSDFPRNEAGKIRRLALREERNSH